MYLVHGRRRRLLIDQPRFGLPTRQAKGAHMPRGKGIYRDEPRTKLDESRRKAKADGNGDSTEDTTTADDANSPDPQEPPD